MDLPGSLSVSLSLWNEKVSYGVSRNGLNPRGWVVSRKIKLLVRHSTILYLFPLRRLISSPYFMLACFHDLKKIVIVMLTRSADDNDKDAQGTKRQIRTFFSARETQVKFK